MINMTAKNDDHSRRPLCDIYIYILLIYYYLSLSLSLSLSTYIYIYMYISPAGLRASAARGSPTRETPSSQT